ncbi:hypothetical protein I6F37_42640, partial [Bradyrhizobium sp. NBAIM08]|nr:hypothetical protein [Bradyrhizobium sp. NBAIM08]
MEFRLSAAGIARPLRCFAPLLGAAVLASASLGQPPRFRDLNHNGQLDPYENPTLDAAARAADLLGRMTIEEKVGAMLHGNLPGADALGRGDAGYDLVAAEKLIAGNAVNSLITRLVV